MKVLFFDGHCSLCNGVVDWMMRHDRRGEIKFASLQGETAKKMIPEIAGAADYDTVVYSREGVTHVRSAAVLEALGDLGGVWSFAKVFFFVPAIVRNVCYRWVARNRFRLFGRRESCRMPTPADRQRLLP